MLEILSSQVAPTAAVATRVLLIIALSLALSALLAYVYHKTFRGFSYSRNHAQAIVLLAVISSILIQAVGDSLERALAILAAILLVRFRATLKDSRESLFLLASMATGVACGTESFTLAIIGTLVFSLVVTLLHFSPLGPSCYFDGMLRFTLPAQSSDRSRLEQTMQHYCEAFSLVTLCERKHGAQLEYAYHVKLRNNKTHHGLLAELKTLETLHHVNLFMQGSRP